MQSLAMDRDDLKDQVRAVSYTHLGELFEVNENQLQVVSLDGHRISIRKVRLKDHYDDIKVIVPGKTLGEISKILVGDNEKEVLIYFSSNHILFEFDSTIVVSRRCV